MTSIRFRRTLGCILTLALLATACAAAPPRKRTSREQWQQPQRVIKDLGLKAGDAVADIGAGRGYFTFPLARIVGDKGKVYASEVSQKLVDALTKIAKDKNVKSVQPVLSGFTETKLDDQCVDAAIIVNVLHHVKKEHRADLVKDIVRSIRPGGSLFVIDWRFDAKINHDKGRRIPRADLIKLGTDAGLKLDAEYYYLEHQVFLRLRRPVAAK